MPKEALRHDITYLKDSYYIGSNGNQVLRGADVTVKYNGKLAIQRDNVSTFRVPIEDFGDLCATYYPDCCGCCGTTHSQMISQAVEEHHSEINQEIERRIAHEAVLTQGLQRGPTVSQPMGARITLSNGSTIENATPELLAGLMQLGLFSAPAQPAHSQAATLPTNAMVALQPVQPSTLLSNTVFRAQADQISVPLLGSNSTMIESSVPKKYGSTST